MRDSLPSRALRALRQALGRGAAPTAIDPRRVQASGYSDSNTFGNATTGYRSRSTATLTDLRDARPCERRDAMRNSRFIRAKLGIGKAIFENTTRYSLGRGLMPSSSCTDEPWADEANEQFLEWASRKTFDISESLTFFEAQKVVMPDAMTDGDLGAAPVRNYEGQPCVQHFNGELIANSPGESIFNPERRYRWREGILRRSAGGAPIAYRVLRDPREVGGPSASRAYWDYPARYFWHVGRTDRLNANRPLPWMHHGDQSSVNILDLNILEMQAAKLNSYFAAAIKVAAGGDMPAGITDLLTRESETVADAAADGTATTKAVERTYLNLMGGAGIPVLEQGEELQFFRNERPSTTFAGFIEYLVSDIAIGFGLPVQFVWSLTGLAGPHARLVLQQADWFFTDCADFLVTNYCQPVWEAFISDRMNRGLLRAPAAGSGWRRVQWQGPGSMTIDKGRDGKLFLDQVLHGMGRRSAWHEMNGKHGLTELKKTVREIRYIMDLCEESGVPVEFVLGKQAANANTATDPDEAAEEIAARLAQGA